MVRNKKKEYLNWRDNPGEIIFLLIFGFIKAIVSTIFQFAWGLASIFLLNGLLVYFKADIKPIELFLHMEQFFINYWKWAFAVIFLIELYNIFKEWELI